MSGLTIAHAKSDTCDPVIRRCGTAMGTKIGRNEMEIPPLDQTMFSRPRPRFGDATVHADAVLTVLQMPTWQHAVSHARSAREFPGRLDQTMIFQAATKVWECGCTRRHHPRAYAPARSSKAQGFVNLVLLLSNKMNSNSKPCMRDHRTLCRLSCATVPSANCEGRSAQGFSGRACTQHSGTHPPSFELWALQGATGISKTKKDA